MNDAIDPTGTAIEFRSLTDIFFGSQPLTSLFDPSWINITDVPSLVDTQTTTLASICRALMMRTCEANSANLRAKISGQDASTLALYRGFSRFMLEDLALHRSCQNLSQSQRKKLSARVAFEMIKVGYHTTQSILSPLLPQDLTPKQRNQAYSNLVELLFPQHIRLSIHA